MDKNHTACFTGHRSLASSTVPLLKKWLMTVILDSIREGYLFFATGGALGFDTLAAKTVLDMRQEYPEIKLTLVLPCYSLADHWKQDAIEEYERINVEADEVVYTSEKYYRGCMHKRNRFLVDGSTLCICYLKKILEEQHILSIMLRRKGSEL